MTSQPRTVLGKTGLSITRLGYGISALRAADSSIRPDLTSDDAGRILNEVLDLGINYLDTAPVYGIAEQLVGRYISHRRNEYFLAGKVGFLAQGLPLYEPRNADGYAKDWTAKGVRDCVEWSLRAMATDHLDLVQLARAASVDELETTGALEELLALKEEGKVLHLGLTGTLTDLDDQLDRGFHETVQFPYSAFRLDFGPAIKQVKELGLGTIVRGSGTTRNRQLASSLPETTGTQEPGSTSELDSFLAAGLDDLLEGETKISFVLRYTLSNPSIDTTIVGTSNHDHLIENIEAAIRGPLDRDVYEEATRRLNQVR